MSVEIDMHRSTETLVQREVMLCLSSMVATLATGVNLTFADRHSMRRGDGQSLIDLAQQAAELCAPVLDYEEAARQEGWRNAPLYGIVKGGLAPGVDNTDDAERDPEADDYDMAAGWEDACYGSGIDPYEWEVFEHWAVSNWLAEKLSAEGERVDMDFAGLNVWARTTTGQAISMDAVIQKIARELFKL